MPDPSSFYRLNEEIAAELARLEGEGQLTQLLGLLEDAGVELFVTSARPREGLEELLGALRPLRDGAPTQAAVRTLAPADGDRLGCAVPAEDAVETVRSELKAPRGGWDHEGFLAARSRFTVLLPGGEPREVYMPDHVCPACYNEAGNAIDSCSRVCGACQFAW